MQHSDFVKNMKGHLSEYDLTNVLGLQFIAADYEQNSDLILLNFYISDERIFLMSRIKYGF